MKQVKRFDILEITDKDIAIAFWYEDGTKEIVVLTLEAAQKMIEQLMKSGVRE